MKCNKWTLALASAGVVSLGSVVQAEESQVLTALSSTTLSGYVDTSAIWNISDSRHVPGRSFDGSYDTEDNDGEIDGTKQDSFNLNVVKLSLERPVGETTWGAGYKVDLLFGPDANIYGTQSDVSTGASDFGIKQAYVNLRAPIGNGIDFKVGVWDTIIGYEVFESGNNPNYSRSYGYFIEPTTHTGVLASYQVNEVIGLSAGIANGYGPTINNAAAHAEGAKTYMGAITLTAPDSAGFLAGSALYAGVVDSSTSLNLSGMAGNPGDVVNWYIGGAMPTPIEGLSVGAAHDYRSNALADGSFEHATSIYASLQATDKLRLNGRAEYAEASKVAGLGGSGLTEVFGLTGTIDYSLWANVISRLEARWDRDLDGSNFGDNDKHDLSLAANIIYQF